ncbi:MAG: cation-translocating P-type ATPase [Parachlamydiaceae bacterium]
MNTPSSASPFTEFFELGHQESVSPFLEASSRQWSANLTLKASLCSALLLVVAFICSFFPVTTPLSHLLLVTVYFLAGAPSLIESIEDLLEGDVNIDILMTLAAFSSVFIGSGMEGALLLVLFALSGSMEDAVTAQAKGSLSSLHKLSPTIACVVQPDGTVIEKAVRDVPIGTQILIKAGQVIPMDGTVVSGTSSVNLVHLTGENFPVTKTVGDLVPTGGRNLDGALTVEVTRTSTDSTLAKIIQLVTQAQEARPALQRWFDRLSQGYAITIISLSTFFALTMPLILSIPFLGVEGSIYRALAFLIAASPCALIIAIPIAYLSAVSACAKRGILLKGGITLDALCRCRTIAFDKTGTLTTGELTCTAFEPLSSLDAGKEVTRSEINEALAAAYAIERNAVHPIAGAIARYVEPLKLKNISLNDFRSIPGQGLQGTAVFPDGNKQIYIGRPTYILAQLSQEQQNLLTDKIRSIQENGELLAILLVDTQPFIFSFRDTPRANIAKVLNAVKRRGLDTVMLTGDHLSSAARIAKELGITEFHADLTPADKLSYVTDLAENGGLAMIGDGVNDAPALSRATVGLCMGGIGSSAAIEAADAIFLHDNIERLDWLLEKAHQTQRIVKQNLFLAAGAILCASLPALGGIVPLWAAVVMHEGGTILVGLNALRLFWVKD